MRRGVIKKYFTGGKRGKENYTSDLSQFIYIFISFTKGSIYFKRRQL